MSGPCITIGEILRAAYPKKSPDPFIVREYDEPDIVLTMEQISQMKSSDFNPYQTYCVGNLSRLNFMQYYSCLGYDSRSEVSAKLYEELIKANPLIGHVGNKSYEFFAGLAGFKDKRNLNKQAQNRGEKSFAAFLKKNEITTFTYPLENGFKIVVFADGSYKTVDNEGNTIYEREEGTLFIADCRTEIDLPTEFMSIYYNFPLIYVL